MICYIFCLNIPCIKNCLVSTDNKRTKNIHDNYINNLSNQYKYISFD